MKKSLRDWYHSLRTVSVANMFRALAYTRRRDAEDARFPAPPVDPTPRPAGAVNDFAGVISAAERDAMENLAREVLQKTGTAVVVATVATVGDMAADD